MEHVQLPTIAERERIIDTRQMATLCGVSLVHLRRLYRTGKVPAPIKVGTRKLGWRVGNVVDFLDAKEHKAA